MTLELADFDRMPGYAGPLHAFRNPALANRFHFWRGASGRRYPCTRFSVHRSPTYADAVSLFVRRRGAEAVVLGISADPDVSVVPIGTEEIHLHIVRGGAEALSEAFADLAALVVRSPQVAFAGRRAA
jgi:uncharacterized membrane protein YhfC